MVLNLTLNSLKAHPHTGLRADTPPQAHTNPQHPSPAHTHTHTHTHTNRHTHPSTQHYSKYRYLFICNRHSWPLSMCKERLSEVIGQFYEYESRVGWINSQIGL